MSDTQENKGFLAKHGILERSPTLLLVGSLLVVSIGGIVAIMTSGTGASDPEAANHHGARQHAHSGKPFLGHDVGKTRRDPVQRCFHAYNLSRLARVKPCVGGVTPARTISWAHRCEMSRLLAFSRLCLSECFLNAPRGDAA